MKKFAFTMAEILISLTIIGIIAAITLPALQGNINEKTWNTQRKALHSRLSQAIALMPALNGFGTTGTTAQIQAKTAEVFLTDGLSKVLKINNICDKDHLEDCGIPDKITILGGGSTINTPTRLTDLNPSMMSNLYDPTGTEVLKYLINSYAAAFETANGESVLTFYNPYCTNKDTRVPLIIEGSSRPGFSNKIHVCANFIYDLNGKKGPNTVGKDIGFITALYSYDPSVVMAIPTVLLDGKYTQTEAIQACKAVNEEYTIPNRDEAASTYYNNNLHSTRRQTWTSESVDSTHALYNSYVSGGLYSYPKAEKNYVTCIKR